ncbi:hypothetical protein Cph01nite_31190 [Cellulomonas phragmiteti]|uniref:DUF4352 domain-containing protein n=1 Tax=Cellulomonas phragmiteti TaxID=478780 RepID=A0ABQ4DPT6_9CELL|nr:hypothetical protein Cph01nite_31190 [Cellulomonas phragmiteti]
MAAAAAALLAAAGCTSTASAGGSTEPAEIATYAGGQTSFGESFTYANGLVIEVKKPVPFVPTAQAEGLEAADGQPVKVRISIINGSSVEYVPDTLGVTIVSGGKQAEQIIDPGSRIELTGPSRALGRSGVVAFDLAFVVEDPEDLTLSLVPSLGGYDPMVLTTS